MVNELNDLIRQILGDNVDLLAIAVKQRSKFEGWLKFELAYALSRKYSDVEVERYIEVTKGHVDLYANESLIELKTPNTNYRNAQCGILARPITKNVESIIHDIEKLQSIQFVGKKYIAFTMFPLDAESAYRKHIDKIIPYLKSHVEAVVPIQGIPVLVFTGEV